MKKEKVAYQNYDIVLKKCGESFKGKTFRAFGLELPKVRQVMPTNIPAVKANELRIDNLFELEDDTVAVVDYESSYKKSDKVKYLNYLTGIANRYLQEKKPCPALRMIVIYTGDIKRKQVAVQYNIGAVKISIEPAFLSELDRKGLLSKLTNKIMGNQKLTDEELMELIILPLAYRKKEEKEEGIHKVVELAARIQDRGQQLFVLAGILTFTDKIMDEEEANKIRRAIEMTKVEMIIEREKQQAVEQAKELERKKITETVELLLETKNKELAEKDGQYQKELAEKESQYQQELAKLRAYITELESAMK